MSNRSVFSRRTGRISTLLLLVIAAVSARAEENLGDQICSKVQQIFEERRDATVRVEAYDRHGKLCGSGFFVDPIGTIYTLAYIVGNADEIFVVFEGKKMRAKLLMADPRSGIALIKVEHNSPFIPIGESKDLTEATPLMTIGFPVGQDATPSFGILSGFDRQFLGHYFMTTHIRASLPVEPGFGGAPLLNLKGEAVGIVFSGIGGGGACYALPIDAAEKIRMDYVRFGEPRHGWVGVIVEEKPDAVHGSRVQIAELSPNGPAAQSGLKTGDTLIRIGDVPITKADDVIDASFFLTAGDSVSIAVVRDGKEMAMDVRTADHPISDAPLLPQGGLKELHVHMPVPPTGNLKLE